MNLDHAARPHASPDSGARFDQTIDRRLVHRTSLAEVFVTDTVAGSSDTFYAWGQLPRSHAYYGDHQSLPARHDTVLLLEFVRQAALAGAHAHFGVPYDDKFILTRQKLTVHRPDLLVVGATPGQVDASVITQGRKERAGALVGIDHSVEVRVGDERVATAEIGLRFRSPESYATLRVDGRGGVAPGDTATITPEHRGVPVAPHLVARHRDENVLLRDAEVHVLEGTVTARLRAPHDHPSLFDHPQDHLPGMVLVEAARQMAVLAGVELLALAPSRMCVGGVDATYSRFGELEPETQLRAHVAAEGSAEAAAVVVVQVVQDGEPISRVDVSLCRSPR